jgi:glycerophosphoryl diester phosphodiesterase
MWPAVRNSPSDGKAGSWAEPNDPAGSPRISICQRRGGRTGDGGGHAILTLEDLIAVARAGSVRTARVIGVHASMVHPAYFAGLDLAVEPRLASVIRSAGYNAPAAAMFVASPEINALKTIGELTRARRVLRIAADTPAPTALTAILAHAEAMAVGADLLLDLSSARTLPATPLVADAHATGLAVQAWTNDADTPFPPPPLRSGDARRLLAALFAAGVDAVAGDLAGPIVRARDDAAPRDRG